MRRSGIRRMTIVVDQTCAPLAERLRAIAPVFVFTLAGGMLTPPGLAVDELRGALRGAGLSGRFLVVAASFAGFMALLYAHRYPQEIAGLVLVDGSHPRQSEALLAALPDREAEDPEVAAFRSFLRGPGAAWEAGCRALAKVAALGDLPLMILAAGSPAMPASLPPASRARVLETWHALQREHAGRSTRGEMRIVPGSGHAIVADAPEAVIAGVKDLVARVSRQKTPSNSSGS